MNKTALENQIIKDKFAVAQVALYLFASLQHGSTSGAVMYLPAIL